MIIIVITIIIIIIVIIIIIIALIASLQILSVGSCISFCFCYSAILSLMMNLQCSVEMFFLSFICPTYIIADLFLFLKCFLLH